MQYFFQKRYWLGYFLPNFGFNVLFGAFHDQKIGLIWVKIVEFWSKICIFVIKRSSFWRFTSSETYWKADFVDFSDLILGHSRIITNLDFFDKKCELLDLKIASLCRKSVRPTTQLSATQLTHESERSKTHAIEIKF